MKACGNTGKSYNVFHAHKSEKQQYHHRELYISLGENCNKCISALSTQFDLSYISKSHFYYCIDDGNVGTRLACFWLQVNVMFKNGNNSFAYSGA